MPVCTRVYTARVEKKIENRSPNRNETRDAESEDVTTERNSARRNRAIRANAAD